jgi:mono/diheme cytochrome c family protein/peroxiredoxin
MRSFLVLGIVLSSFTSAFAQSADTVFEKFDRDGDGRVTSEELPSKPTFQRYDTNKDGAITLAEYKAVIGNTPAESPLRRLGKKSGATANAPSIKPEDLKKITSGPEVLKPGEVGIGRMIPDVAFTDLAGKSHRLSDSRKGTVIIMTSATCPVSKRYASSIAELHKEIAGQGLTLLLVNPLASEKPEEIKAQLAAAGLTATYVQDKEKALAGALEARTTTEVFLLDAARTLVYRGAFDDQYGINYNLDAPKHRYLRDAIAAFLRGDKPAVQASAAPGCELDLPEKPTSQTATAVTYHRDVARILQQNCVTCHRDGGVAPFALDDLEEVQDRAKTIRRVVTEGTMPPWFAGIEKDAAKNPWANDCSLSPRDKADLLAWIDSKDRPVGNPTEAPLKRSYPSEWSIGKPDMIVQLSKAYDIKATGFMPYAHDVVETELTEDRWVQSYEILPSARDVVHHVIVRVHEKGSEVRKADEGSEGYWAIYVPGNGASVYPEGFARKIPAGAKVSFQIHYTPSGVAKKERLKMGLVFAKHPPTYEVRTAPLANVRLAIPPGAPRHLETHSQRVPFDMPVTGFMPHMHTRGAGFRYEVTYPDGKNEVLLDIPRYDFNWQLRYELKQPKLIPKGSTLKITAAFDNSAGNKANPDPTKLVKWGSQTVDEMMIGYVEYFRPLSP